MVFCKVDIDPRTFQADQLNRSLGDGARGSEGVLFYDRPSMLKAYKALLLEDGIPIKLHAEQRPTQSLWNLTMEASRFPILLNWYPNTLTLKSPMLRLDVPDCVTLRARTPVNSIDDPSCAFEINQLVKVSWAGLSDAAPLISQLIDRFYIKQTEYIQLLRGVSFAYICFWVPSVVFSILFSYLHPPAGLFTHKNLL